MKDFAKYILTAIAALVLLVLSGCSSMMMVNERAISLEDIIDLSEAELSSEVIISHIDATNSVFKLTSDEIIRLKEAGVDNEVIAHILEIDIDTERFAWMDSTSPYEYWSHYSTSYYYPVYDYYFNRYSGYYYPYSNYYRPLYSRYYGGLSLNNNPYYVRRTPGLVGRFYEYAPSVPLYGRDVAPGRRLRSSDSSGSDNDSEENGGGVIMRRRYSDSNGSSGGISAPRRSSGTGGSDSSGSTPRRRDR